MEKREQNKYDMFTLRSDTSDRRNLMIKKAVAEAKKNQGKQTTNNNKLKSK